MSNTFLHRRLGLTALALSALSACGTATRADPAPSPVLAAPPPMAAGTALVFAVPQAGGKTAQGGQHEAFAYSEKLGDASVEKVTVVDGVARVMGTVWPQKGSSWAGIGFMASGGAADKTVDVSSHQTLRLQLASATTQQLRVRVMGPDQATRDSGCYPIVMVPVSPALRELEIALDRFAPDGYCGTKGRSIADTAKAVTAIEVSDPALTPGARRAVDFQVGRIELKP